MSAEATQIEDVAQAMDTTVDDVERALDEAEGVLRDLADLDLEIEDAADLERARRSLPSDPTTAMLVDAALAGTRLGDALEYVSPSERQDGYWRRSRERSDPRALSDAELRQRHAFATAAMERRGLEGTVRTPDGRRIPKAAAETGAEIEGEDFTTEDDDVDGEKGKGLLRRILGA